MSQAHVKTLDYRWRTFVGLLWGLIVAGALTFLPAVGIDLEGVDGTIKDWRSLLFSERAPDQRSDIAIVLITEESIADYPYRSPVDRGLLAELVRAVDSAQPAAIGLDFIVDRPSFPERDAQFIEAVKQAKAPVVLGAIDKRADLVDDRALAFQDELITKTGKKAGHLFFTRPDQGLTFGDEVIRSAYTVSPDPPHRRSFAALLANKDIDPALSKSFTVDWLRPPDATTEAFLTLRVPRHAPVDGSGGAKEALPAAWLPALTGKTVLIGGAFIDRDRHYTPLSISSRKRVPGVTIHAQILAQLKDGRVLTSLNGLQLILAFALLTFAGFMIEGQYRLHRHETLVKIAGTLLLVLVSLATFKYAKLLLPPSLFLAWLLGITGGHYWNVLTRKLSKQNVLGSSHAPT